MDDTIDRDDPLDHFLEARLADGCGANEKVFAAGGGVHLQHLRNLRQRGDDGGQSALLHFQTDERLRRHTSLSQIHCGAKPGHDPCFFEAPQSGLNRVPRDSEFACQLDDSDAALASQHIKKPYIEPIETDHICHLTGLSSAKTELFDQL